jgi:predicted transcriptional regulator
MRDRIRWLTQSDERVLEFLEEKEIEASPSVIAANIDYNPSYISRRCKKLLAADLIQHTSASNYRITTLGVDYLDGLVDPDDVPEPESSDNGVEA